MRSQRLFGSPVAAALLCGALAGTWMTIWLYLSEVLAGAERIIWVHRLLYPMVGLQTAILCAPPIVCRFRARHLLVVLLCGMGVYAVKWGCNHLLWAMVPFVSSTQNYGYAVVTQLLWYFLTALIVSLSACWLYGLWKSVWRFVLVAVVSCGVAAAIYYGGEKALGVAVVFDDLATIRHFSETFRSLALTVLPAVLVERELGRIGRAGENPSASQAQ